MKTIIIKSFIIAGLMPVFSFIGCNQSDDDAGTTAAILAALLNRPVATTGTTGTTAVGVSAQCQVNSGTGNSTLALQGASFCSVNGTAPAFTTGSATLNCESGSTVSLTGSCTALNCQFLLTSLSGGLSFVGAGLPLNTVSSYSLSTSFSATCP